MDPFTNSVRLLGEKVEYKYLKIMESLIRINGRWLVSIQWAEAEYC